MVKDGMLVRRSLSSAPGLIIATVVWKRVVEIAPSSGVRFVGVYRRGYDKSTPYPPEEFKLLTTPNGVDEAKQAILDARGIEVAQFVDAFITSND